MTHYRVNIEFIILAESRRAAAEQAITDLLSLLEHEGVPTYVEHVSQPEGERVTIQRKVEKG